MQMGARRTNFDFIVSRTKKTLNIYKLNTGIGVRMSHTLTGTYEDKHAYHINYTNMI